MRKYLYIFLVSYGLSLLLPACKHVSDQEVAPTETVVKTETEEPTFEEFTHDGEKITTFKISGKACNEWWGDTTADLYEFLNSGTYWAIEDDFISVDDKNSYVELKMSESDIKVCKKRMFERIGVEPSDSLQGDSFFYYNEKYDKVVAYVRVDERFGKLYEIGMVKICLMTLQMLAGVDADECKVNTTIINPDTGNVVIEMNENKEYVFKADDWK